MSIIAKIFAFRWLTAFWHSYLHSRREWFIPEMPLAPCPLIIYKNRKRLGKCNVMGSILTLDEKGRRIRICLDHACESATWRAIQKMQRERENANNKANH